LFLFSNMNEYKHTYKTKGIEYWEVKHFWLLSKQQQKIKFKFLFYCGILK
jgi:hypothetical protein